MTDLDDLWVADRARQNAVKYRKKYTGHRR
ncbi:hypothetical protein J2S43_004907 [Catenuloplanes nepalensis]|uniref:Uncharacterized protein n=1 Tax=Catenuloplanes nepalensis TaxID=587533 RepID=A0ABT9MYD4_9ACTN|nr:hypothetical protein [Catenuloplanes nepalensis]